MIRRSFRIGLTLGVLAGLAYAVTKMLGGSRPATSPEHAPTTPPAPAATPPVQRAAAKPPAPPGPAPTVPRSSEPKPSHTSASGSTVSRGDKTPAKKAPAKKPAAKKSAAKKSAAATVWITPDGDVCPTSHPVKAKLSSKIFHLPGMLNYDRTKPDRCYRDAGGAEGDGLRAAKR